MSSSEGQSPGLGNQKACLFGKASTLELLASDCSVGIEEETAYTV